jgi:hypothetical protein
MSLALRRDEPVVCAKCGRKTKRHSRQQRYCSDRCRSLARERGGKRRWGTNPLKNTNDFNKPQGPKSRSMVAKKPLWMDFDGFVVEPDQNWPGMYRVRRPDGSLTDMVNLSRARDAAQVFAEQAA